MMVLSMASRTQLPRRFPCFCRVFLLFSGVVTWLAEVLRIDPLLAAAGNSAALQLFGDVGSSGQTFWLWLKGWEG